MWRRLYGRQSNRDGGTLLQLRNLLGRSSVPNDPKSNVNATTDFIEVTLAGYAVCAAMEVLGMEKITDQPDDLPSPEMCLSAEEKKRTLSSVTSAIVSQFINLTVTLQEDSEAPKSKRRKRKSKSGKSSDSTAAALKETDRVFEYSREFLTLGMLHAEFNDSEGDGIRLLRCWKFFCCSLKCLIVKTTASRL